MREREFIQHIQNIHMVVTGEAEKYKPNLPQSDSMKEKVIVIKTKESAEKARNTLLELKEMKLDRIEEALEKHADEITERCRCCQRVFDK